MRAKRKKLRKSVKRKQHFGLWWLALLTAIVVVLMRTVPSSSAPLSPLPVPKHLAQLNYSGPLTLVPFNKNVLGAQTINPLDFVNDINLERAKVGAPALRLNPVLMQAAKMRADVILKYQNFSHQDPHDGIELGTVLPKLNYHFVYASENIGMGGLSATDFVSGFMNSTHHRENLLNPKLTETGAAIEDGPYHQYYVNIAVQLFAIPGGTDEALGYSSTDRRLYEAAYTALNAKLDPIAVITQKILGSPDYSDARITKYIRQKEILAQVLTRMRGNEPLENPDVALILEYNNLL